jgi:chromosome segregation ATPase
MNNIQELIERLNRLLDEDDDSVNDIWERTIYDSITALESMQAPLSNNIQELIERLDAIKALVPEIGMANCEAPIDDAITALERLWRENEEYARRDIMLSDDNTELQQRNEELEGDLMTCKQTRGAAISREKEAAQNMSAIAKENKRLDAALAEIEDYYGNPCADIARKARAGE